MFDSKSKNTDRAVEAVESVSQARVRVRVTQIDIVEKTLNALRMRGPRSWNAG